MKMLTDTAFKLNQEAEKYYEKLKMLVHVYIGKTRPELWNADYSINFMWDCVEIRWKTERPTWGSLEWEADKKNEFDSHYINFSYKEVFGWDQDSTKQISAKWKYDYIDSVIDGFRPKPKELTYDI